jgi:hypothetical protein
LSEYPRRFEGGAVNIYDDPEKFGLQIVAEVEEQSNYSFDKFVVWKDKHGKLYYKSDSGCS